MLVGAGAAALAVMRAPPARALSFDGMFGTVLGAAGVGLFPGAAAALGGFELIRLLGNTNTLVQDTRTLEAHINSVLNDAAASLNTINSFIQDCDRTLQDIDTLLKQLPATVSAALDAAAAKKAFARLRGDSANMAGYLASTGSIAVNRSRIQQLAEKIVNDISQVDALQGDFQFAMQAVPGLATWVKGYTAYNLFVDGASRPLSPWDHPVLANIALPRITSLLQAIQTEADGSSGATSGLPLQPGTVYTFDGSSTFAATTRPFSVRYVPGQIDTGFYYTIWPTNTPWQGLFGPPPAGGFTVGMPQPGDFCYLTNNLGGVRTWAYAAVLAAFPAGSNPDPALPAAIRANVAYPRLLNASLQSTQAFNQLTNGWLLFKTAVDEKLVKGARETWATMPKLP
jgi:hypothetical protein